MGSTKPYLIRAICEWCADEGFTPHLAVQVDARTRVPREFVRDGQIVLNVSAGATHQLLMGNEEISFQTRFNGASFPVLVPVNSVVAIYAKENGQGMAFEVGSSSRDTQGSVVDGVGADEMPSDEQGSEKPDMAAKRGCHLTLIK